MDLMDKERALNNYIEGQYKSNKNNYVCIDEV